MGTPNVPFVAYIKLHPARPNNRIEAVRELQKTCYLIDQALTGVSTIQLAKPGGGQAMDQSIWSDYVSGVAYRPQFGETPAQATVVGFWDSDNSTGLVNPPKQRTITRISGGTVYTGSAGAQEWDGPAPTATANQVKALKQALETALASGLPDVVEYSVWRIDYANQIWGDGGRTFPR